MIDAVLFDLDGTLVDTGDIAAAAFAEAYAECVGAGEAPVAAFKSLSGLPFESILDELQLPPSMVEPFRRCSRARTQEVRLVCGIGDVLVAVRAAGCALGVITGKDRERALEVIEQVAIAEWVEALATPSDPPLPKPAPDGVLWLCDLLGSSADRCIVVGDAAADVIAGNAAGAATVACLWGEGRERDLLEADPSFVVRTPRELEELLTASCRPAARDVVAEDVL